MCCLNPFSHFLYLSYTGLWGVYPMGLRVQGEEHWTGCQAVTGHTHAHRHTRDNLEIPISLRETGGGNGSTCRKHANSTQAGRRWELNHQPWRCCLRKVKTLQGCNSDSTSFQAISPDFVIHYFASTASLVMLDSVPNSYKTLMESVHSLLT